MLACEDRGGRYMLTCSTPPGFSKWLAHFSGALAIFLDPGYLVSPRPSERGGVFNSKRRSADLGAFYLNSSPSLVAK